MRPRDIIWNWFFSEWKWIITTLVAFYAAGLTTWRELQARKEKKAQMKVKIFGSMLLLDGSKRTPLIQARIEHHGGPALTFSDNCCSIAIEGEVTRFLLWDGKMTSITSWPHEMKPHTSFDMSISRESIVSGLRKMKGTAGHAKVRAVFSDAILREYQSQWLTLDLATGEPVGEKIGTGPPAR